MVANQVIDKFKFVVVMPVRGRYEQSIDCMKRLISTAGYPAKYIAITGADDEYIVRDMQNFCTGMVSQSPSLTYWQALHYATVDVPDDTYIVNVANDILPCNLWLLRATEILSQQPWKVIGFNGDGYLDHACHFIIQMKRIRNTGGWPLWYFHNFGDTEIIYRARQDGLFHKDPWSILFHNHPIISGQQTDDVYKLGMEHYEHDKRLFEHRRQSGWTH